jgi:hypothetical protein
MECQSKQGFFALRGCGEAAAQNCDACQRPTCSRHLSPSSGFTRCLDCAARDAEGEATNKPDAATANPDQFDATVDDRDWAYRYRGSYYSRYGGSPFYPGYPGVYYSSYDRWSFDRDRASTSGTGMVDDRDDATDWGDS